MKIVAKTIKGKEFFYDPTTAHRVNIAKAELIAKTLNGCGYSLKGDQTWHTYDIDRYDVRAYVYAENQQFIMKHDGTLIRRA